MFGKKTESRQWKTLFTLYDSKAENYRFPLTAENQHEMVRELENLMRDSRQERNPIYMNAEDFSLFEVGKFCLKTGEIEKLTPMKHIANLHEIRSLIQKEAPRDPILKDSHLQM